MITTGASWMIEGPVLRASGGSNNFFGRPFMEHDRLHSRERLARRNRMFKRIATGRMRLASVGRHRRW